MPFDFSTSYEALNPGDDGYRYYSGLAARLGAQRVIDLGCGTGVLAALIAGQGVEVLGVDPGPEMLRVARARAGGDQVIWVLGDATDLPDSWADLVTMSGHVAQVFRTEDEWAATLAEVRRALRGSGCLAFEMRDPAARAWEDWTRAETLRTVETGGGLIEFWHETVDVALPLVTYETKTKDLVTGEVTSTPDTLAFRDEATLRRSLTAAGFEVVEVYGSWDCGPVVPGRTRELIVTARQLDRCVVTT